MRSFFGSMRGLTRPAIIRRPYTIDTMAPHQIARAAAVPIRFDADAPEHAISVNAAEAMPFDKERARQAKGAVAVAPSISSPRGCHCSLPPWGCRTA
jgi:hypothetical protein